MSSAEVVTDVRGTTCHPVLAGQNVGIRQLDEHVWLVTFTQYDPGFFDDETCRLEPGKNPFEAI